MEDSKSSYKQIVKSTGIFGGTQLVNILLGVIRNKIIAVLLGASGVGLMGIYQSIIDMVRSVGGLGMETTGVKEIASANAEGNSQKIAYTVYYVHRLIQYTALTSSLVCLVFCYPISLWAFGDSSHSIYIASLSLVVLLSTLSQGQMVIFQGLRQIRTMAKVLVVGNFLSLISTIPFYFLWGINGIIPAFIVAAGIYYLLSLRYYIPLEKSLEPLPKKPNFSEVLRKGNSMFHLGVYLVVSSVLSTVVMFLIRIFFTQRLGVESAGLFQAVWMITNIYLMLILKSMGTDFYPRLSGVAANQKAAVKLINEQTLISLLVGTPIIVGMLLFGFLVLILLYSSKFLSAESLLQWQILGTFFKVLSWPMAFILLALNKGKHYLVSEFSFFAIFYGSNYLLFPYFGLNSAGISYFISYIFYLLIIYYFSIRLIRFHWVKQVWFGVVVSGTFVFAAFLLGQSVKGFSFYLSAVFLLILSIGYSVFELNKLVSLKNAVRFLFRKR